MGSTTTTIPPTTTKRTITNCLGESSCPTGTITCNGISKYCYYPAESRMVSTYMLPQYDYCPFDGTGKSDGGKLTYIDGVPVWPRIGGKDINNCTNL